MKRLFSVFLITIVSFFKWYIDGILSEFKQYRKKKRGTWYYICDAGFATGFGSAASYWTRNLPAIDENMSIVKIETY